MSKKIDNSYGPKLFNRDENGLLNNIQYTFNEDGSINWRAMVKEEHLFPNRTWFEKFKKEVPKTIEGLKDHQLLIKLSGIKELARLRGFDSVKFETIKCEQDHVAVKCQISFISNYETSDKVIYEDMANATVNNCSSFAVKFLETIASNRAFVRAVRNFLNIHIVGFDEMDTSESNFGNSLKNDNLAASFSPQKSLENNFYKLSDSKDFESFLDFLLELKNSSIYINKDVESWGSFSDIPSKESRILLKIIKEKFS